MCRLTGWAHCLVLLLPFVGQTHAWYMCIIYLFKLFYLPYQSCLFGCLPEEKANHVYYQGKYSSMCTSLINILFKCSTNTSIFVFRSKLKCIHEPGSNHCASVQKKKLILFKISHLFLCNLNFWASEKQLQVTANK